MHPIPGDVEEESEGTHRKGDQMQNDVQHRRRGGTSKARRVLEDREDRGHGRKGGPKPARESVDPSREDAKNREQGQTRGEHHTDGEKHLHPPAPPVRDQRIVVFAPLEIERTTPPDDRLLLSLLRRRDLVAAREVRRGTTRSGQGEARRGGTEEEVAHAMEPPAAIRQFRPSVIAVAQPGGKRRRRHYMHTYRYGG